MYTKAQIGETISKDGYIVKIYLGDYGEFRYKTKILVKCSKCNVLQEIVEYSNSRLSAIRKVLKSARQFDSSF